MSGIVKGSVLISSRLAPSAGGVEAGTKMIFNQTAAPTGWTKVTGSGNDHALRLTTGTVGTGGSVAFETAFASHTGAAHTLALSETPSHNHNWNRRIGGGGSTVGYDSAPNATNASSNVSVLTAPMAAAGGGGSHSHGSIDLNVSFVDVIIATKD